MEFRYLRDPLFLVCVTAYFVNRWLVRPTIDSGFWHSHFNDLICIPFWVPILVWLVQRAGWRKHHRPPQGPELLVPLVVWSVWFEVCLPNVPFFQGRSHADPLDIAYYCAGALLASFWWEWWYAAPTATVKPAM